MDYPCAKFGDCSFSRFGQTESQTDTQTRMIALLMRISFIKRLVCLFCPYKFLWQIVLDVAVAPSAPIVLFL